MHPSRLETLNNFFRICFVAKKLCDYKWPGLQFCIAESNAGSDESRVIYKTVLLE